ncbi:hypothetical protein [Domibacillus robiginosus]|uniref:hypothetical protein n=1 Tax=Domibacillus robiginosus TaxID=1071054 RepID=UPI000ADAD545|nr:hypothetical protein [Domibacillus robiginosus]
MTTEIPSLNYLMNDLIETVQAYIHLNQLEAPITIVLTGIIAVAALKKQRKLR